MARKRFELTALSLHILAMICMVFDHAWASVVSGNLWMNCVGRLTFPIFAFLIVEGYFHTGNFKKYVTRMFFFALLSEIPMNMLYNGSYLYPFHQNVLWTFLIALLAMKLIDRVRETKKPAAAVILTALIVLFSTLLGLVSMVDYNAPGILTVFAFYFFHGRKWYHYLGQFLVLYWLNVDLLRGMDLPLSLFGFDFFFPTQGFALFALIPIWLYRGKQGLHNRWIQYGCYAFYPVHMMLLGILANPSLIGLS